MSQGTLPEAHADAEPERRSGELTPRELLRWGWRQLTSMRTALVLLLLLALAAIPGSIIPQSGVDSLKTSRWQEQHPQLTPIYERLGLFAVFDSAWFSAIYLLLMISLVGCIVPRLFVYARALRAKPPAAPRNLSRLPVHTSYVVDEPPADVLERARRCCASGGIGSVATPTDGRRSRRGAWLPARGRQPAVPLRRPGGAGGLRSRQPVRLQGRRDPGGGQRVRQQPDPVRRLRPGLAVRPEHDGALQLRRRRVRRRLADLGPAAGHGARLQRAPDLSRESRVGRSSPTTSRSTTR